MTPEQVEKVRGYLRELHEILGNIISDKYSRRLAHSRVDAALAALDGEGEDVWTVGDPCSYGYPILHRGRVVAYGIGERDAHAIAADHNRCAKLERAAREVVKLRVEVHGDKPYIQYTTSRRSGVASTSAISERCGPDACKVFIALAEDIAALSAALTDEGMT